MRLFVSIYYLFVDRLKRREKRIEDKIKRLEFVCDRLESINNRLDLRRQTEYEARSGVLFSEIEIRLRKLEEENIAYFEEISASLNPKDPPIKLRAFRKTSSR